MDIDFDKVINKNSLLAWRWAPMCDAVRRSPVISDGAKILYNEIVSFIWQKSEVRAWAGQSTLGKNLSIERKTVGRRLKELVAVGLIGVKRNGMGKTSDIYIYDLDLNLLQVEQDDTGNFVPMPQNALAGATTELSPKVNGLEPVIPLDVPNVSHQDVPDVSHHDGTILTRSADAEGALNSDVEGVSEVGEIPEEETGNIINREEEAAPILNLSIPPEQHPPPEIPTISRNKIPAGCTITWNSTLTEESVVIDGQRYVIMHGDENTIRGTETLEIDDALQNPETVEAEGGNSEIDVNREKMAKLVEDIGSDSRSQTANDDQRAAPRKLSRAETLRKLEEMERCPGGASADSVAVDDS